MTRFIVLLTLFLSSFGVMAGGIEVEIEFRYHPDKSGQKTVNQSIEVEGQEATIEQGDANRSASKKELTEAEVEALIELVAERVNEFTYIEGRKIKGAYVEAKFEFSGEDREIEVTEKFPTGSLPTAYVDLQDKYFDQTFQ